MVLFLCLYKKYIAKSKKPLKLAIIFLSGRRDSNPESLGPKPSALAVTLRPVKLLFHNIRKNSNSQINELLHASGRGISTRIIKRDHAPRNRELY